MKKKFLLCGSLGWCLEVFWTGLHALFSGDPFLTGKTSLWMFPIYGCAVFIGLIYQKISSVPVFFRGCLYTAAIFFTEYSSGIILKYFQICPWDYSQSPYHYKEVIRFDYAPVWFFTGLLYEKILQKCS